MMCFMPVAWKHFSWHYSVMELKTTRPGNFHCMLLSRECQMLLQLSSYSSISSSAKGTQCMYIAVFSVSIPPFYSEVPFKSVTTCWHFRSPHSQTHCGIKKINFHSVFLHAALANLFLGSERVSVWDSVC